MKKALLIFAAAAISSSAFATSLVPPILEMTSGGGFRQPTWSRLTVYANGHVVETTIDSMTGQQVEIVSVLNLDPSVIQGLNILANQVKEEELVDPQPEKPGCMDAPTTTYVIKDRNQDIKIAQTILCKPHLHSSPEANRLVNVLKSLNQLSNVRFVNQK